MLLHPFEMSTPTFNDLVYKPKIRLHIEDLSHPAVASFDSLIDSVRLIPNAINHVLRHLYVPYGFDDVPKVRSVTIKLREMDGVAYTTGLDLDSDHKEIHCSLHYLARNCDQPLKFRDETIGVITHEMVHCFQHNCKGTAPGGLIEGIADFVRSRSGLAPPHWKRTPEHRGNKWDDGYEKTAWFLEWLEEIRGAGMISRMNETMGRVVYKEEDFWPELFGETVETLWKRYKESWKHDQDDGTDEKESSEVALDSGSELEMVNLSQEEKEAADKATNKTPTGK